MFYSSRSLKAQLSRHTEKQMLLKLLSSTQMAYTFLCQRDSFVNEACVITIYVLLKKMLSSFSSKHVFEEKHWPTWLRDLTAKKAAWPRCSVAAVTLWKLTYNIATGFLIPRRIFSLRKLICFTNLDPSLFFILHQPLGPTDLTARSHMYETPPFKWLESFPCRVGWAKVHSNKSFLVLLQD